MIIMHLIILGVGRPESTVSVTSGETSGTDSHTDTQFLMSSDRQGSPTPNSLLLFYLISSIFLKLSSEDVLLTFLSLLNLFYSRN
jgi:hypothetical protein